MKRFITVLSLLLLLSTFIETNAGTEPKGITDDYFAVQYESIEVYNTLLDGLGKSEISDMYGGAFLDDEGQLVVAVTDDGEKTRQEFSTLVNDSSIIFTKVDKTAKQLEQAEETVFNQREYLEKLDIFVDEVYTDFEKNTVIVAVREVDPTKEKVITDELGMDFLTFINSKGLPAPHTIDLDAGLYISDDSGSSCIGFSATKTVYVGGSYVDIDGFVIAGHAPDQLGEDIDRGSTKVGDVYQIAYTDNGKCDAAFVEIDSSNADMSSDIDNGSFLSAATTTSYPQNTWVLMHAHLSGNEYGQILDDSFKSSTNDNMDIYDCVKVNYSSQPGDSGSPITVPGPNGIGRMLVGIHRTSGAYVKYKNIKSALGVNAVVN